MNESWNFRSLWRIFNKGIYIYRIRCRCLYLKTYNYKQPLCYKHNERLVLRYEGRYVACYRSIFLDSHNRIHKYTVRQIIVLIIYGCVPKYKLSMYHLFSIYYSRQMKIIICMRKAVSQLFNLDFIRYFLLSHLFRLIQLLMLSTICGDNGE